jgi:FtsH-binding integral membrane protein
MPQEINGIPQPPNVAISPTAVETRFLTRVYAWMAAGLAVTAAVALYTASNPQLLRAIFGNRFAFWGLALGQLALVAWLSGLVGRLSAFAASGVFLLYSALTGLTLSVVFIVFTSESLASTFVVSAATFGAMSAYGLATKRSLDGLGSFCFMGLIGVIIAWVVNMFLHSSMLAFVTSCVGVIVFVGLTAYDTRKLKMMAAVVDADSEEGRRGAVSGALALYLDFINLFLMLLNLFGRRR